MTSLQISIVATREGEFQSKLWSVASFTSFPSFTRPMMEWITSICEFIACSSEIDEGCHSVCSFSLHAPLFSFANPLLDAESLPSRQIQCFEMIPEIEG